METIVFICLEATEWMQHLLVGIAGISVLQLSLGFGYHCLWAPPDTAFHRLPYHWPSDMHFSTTAEEEVWTDECFHRPGNSDRSEAISHNQLDLIGNISDQWMGEKTSKAKFPAAKTWPSTYTGDDKWQETVEIIKKNRKFRFFTSCKITDV